MRPADSPAAVPRLRGVTPVPGSASRRREGPGGSAPGGLPRGVMAPRMPSAPPDVVAHGFEPLLQPDHLIAVETGFGAAPVEGRRAGKARRQMTGGQRVDEGLVPLEIDVEIGVEQEGRAAMALRQREARGRAARIERTAIMPGHAPSRPLRDRQLVGAAGFLPGQIGGECALLPSTARRGASRDSGSCWQWSGWTSGTERRMSTRPSPSPSTPRLRMSRPAASASGRSRRPRHPETSAGSAPSSMSCSRGTTWGREELRRRQSWASGEQRV